jgi:hypothetical protein
LLAVTYVFLLWKRISVLLDCLIVTTNGKATKEELMGIVCIEDISTYFANRIENLRFSPSSIRGKR